MEVLCSQKNSLNLVTCRLCANDCDKAIGIYSEEGLTNHLSSKMNQHLPIKVSQTDTLPLYCCLSCTSTLLTWHELYLVCIESDKRLREFNVIDDKSMDAIEFPDEQSHDVEQEIEPEPEPTTSHELESKDFIHSYSQDMIENEDLLEPKWEEIKSENGHLSCDICYESFNSLYNRTHHMKTLHPTEFHSKNKKAKSISCNICEVFFKDFEEYKNHEKDHIPHCKEELLQKYRCTLCTEIFNTQLDLDTHYSLEHSSKKTRRKQNAQDSCNEYIDNETCSDARKIEKRRKNAELLEKCVILDEVNKKRYKCPQCEYVFKYPSTFISHQTVHTGEKAFCCHICGKSFRISSGLKHHINEYHLKIKNYPCEVCGVKFTAKSFRNEHMNIHTNNRPYVCDVCGKAFKQSGSLYVHKMFHTNNFRFHCELCDKKFRRATELKIHNRLHTGEKPYKCHLCEAAFIDSKGLKTHIKIHDKSKVFICNICGNKFSQERYLKNHLRNHRKKK